MYPEKLSEVKKCLQNPDNTHRTAMFWSWNGNLQEEELHRQLADFSAKGAGGFFMHSREGLETPYLSEHWKDMVKSCAQKGRELGMLPYIYDDDKWPSGMAGGKVAAADPAFRATAIVLTGQQPGKYQYSGKIQEKTLTELHFQELVSDNVPLYIDVQKSGTSDWYSGSTPADNLNKNSVRAFLNMTHEQYKALFNGAISENVAGFFTDEPNFADFFAHFTPGCPWLPWTDDFDAFFQEKRGYSILPRLPYLFYQGEHAAKTRHDYWLTMTELFSQTYFKQIYDWCEENGVVSTGHQLFENGLCSQARVCGAVMPHYQYLHIPGIDILGERTEEYLTVKQCTSVANQMGRQTVSETYGCTGWQLSFEGQKWLWDWQAVQGISLRCPHLAQYTIKGLRKRDYPPVFSYQAAWWEHDPVMEDYCARLSLFADTGSIQRPVLLLHPQSSLWLRCGSDPEEDLSHFDSNMGWTDSHIMSLNAEYDRINRLAQSLLKNQCDFDFGDELLLQQHGSVKDGLLHMAKAAYQVVVIPDVDTLLTSTLELLRQFAEAGGNILWLRKIPTMVDGLESDAVLKAFPNAHICDSEETLLQVLEAYRLVKISDILTSRAAPIMTSLRKVEDGYLLLAVNNDRSRGYRCKVTLPAVGAVESYDLLTGTSTFLETDSTMGFYQDFTPADARMYFLHTSQPPRFAPIQPTYHDVHESPAAVACLGPEVPFTRTAPNTLTLDCCCWKTDGTWSERMPLWQAQRNIRKQAGFQPIHANGMPMRYAWIYETRPTVHAQLQFTFTVTALPKEAVYVALEEREAIQIFCNGTACTKDHGWFKDRSIQMVQLENLQQGVNTLLLDIAHYSHEMELEDIYICGDFAVDLQGRIVEEPKTLRFGDWCLQGYPYYAGSMIYHFEFVCDAGTARIQLGETHATLVIAKVNGGEPVYIPWQAANGPEVTLQQGRNILDIEVVGSNRNLFGPLHQPYQLCSRIDWQDFRTKDTAASQAPTLVPYGLFGQCYLLR